MGLWAQGLTGLAVLGHRLRGSHGLRGSVTGSGAHRAHRAHRTRSPAQRLMGLAGLRGLIVPEYFNLD